MIKIFATKLSKSCSWIWNFSPFIEKFGVDPTNVFTNVNIIPYLQIKLKRTFDYY